MLLARNILPKNIFAGVDEPADRPSLTTIIERRTWKLQIPATSPEVFLNTPSHR